MSDKLLPCPFCGKDDQIFIRQRPLGNKIGCHNCRLDLDCFGSHQFTVRMWNTRTRPSLDEEKLIVFFNKELRNADRKYTILGEAKYLAKAIMQAYKEGKL